MNNKIGVLSNKNKFFEKIFDIKDNDSSVQPVKNVANNHQAQKELRDDYTVGINKNSGKNYTKKG